MRIFHVLTMCLHLRVVVTRIEEKHRETVERTEMAQQLTFYRRTVNGYQFDDAVFKTLESRRYMNG